MKLTRTGWILAATAAVLLAAGMAADYPEIVALGVGAVVLVLAAAGWTWRKPRVTVERTLVRHRVREGQPLRCRLVVRNDGLRRSPELEVVDDSAERPMRLVLAGVPAAATEELEYELRTRQRGVYVSPPPAVGLTDPLRLMLRARRDGKPDTYYVHPDYHEIQGFGTGGPLDVDGEASVPRRDGAAFYALRPYVPGDERRLIHWPAYARTGELVVRHLSAPDAPECLVVLDTDGELYAGGRFEEAVRLTASFCVAALTAGARLTLRTTTGAELRCTSYTERTGPLDFLSGVDIARRRISWLQAVAGDGAWSSAVVVSGAMKDEDVRGIAAVASSAPTVVVRLDAGRGSARVAAGVRVLTASTCSGFADEWNG
ncbi:DUF58 domain-containing protein [Lentzea sp. NPDC092896]|uniref:DUF58 domain-containing protein n=1 Tax=Lentzea sp. NPDC092896 TaxID=3364127 RepID=UPI003808AFAA